MAEDRLAFELVSPERVILATEAEMVVVPGIEGDFGVLPLHAPVVSLLRPGVVRVYEGSDVKTRLFVAGGFAEVNERGLTVLAEHAEAVDRIDPAEARQRLKNAEEDLADAKEPSEDERRRLERAIEIARARLEAVENPT
ncbi:ATP synthase epsilon chain [bacterium HR40]|nr:ATP synthase epsilon chain [bacterium HR40]